MRTRFVNRYLAFFIFCGFASQAYGADPNMRRELETALQSCKGKAKAGECIDALWSIADIAKDGALSSAELSRVMRLTFMIINETEKDKPRTDAKREG